MNSLTEILKWFKIKRSLTVEQNDRREEVAKSAAALAAVIFKNVKLPDDRDAAIEHLRVAVLAADRGIMGEDIFEGAVLEPEIKTDSKKKK